MPDIHTPKFVITKNINAPTNAPVNLLVIFFEKKLEIKPINNTLLQVKNVPV